MNIGFAVAAKLPVQHFMHRYSKPRNFPSLFFKIRLRGYGIFPFLNYSAGERTTNASLNPLLLHWSLAANAMSLLGKGLEKIL